MKGYSVKQVAKLAGVSVRTLHLYDQKGLLKPQQRTTTGYRLYGEKELLRLQQILFYKELDFPLLQIKRILDDPGFDRLAALQSHKVALSTRYKRIKTLIATIDKTLSNLKQGTMLSHEELYEGLPREEAARYRKEAIEKYGQEQVEQSENRLTSMGKQGFEALKAETSEIWKKLFLRKHLEPECAEVQQLMAGTTKASANFGAPLILKTSRQKLTKVWESCTSKTRALPCWKVSHNQTSLFPEQGNELLCTQRLTIISGGVAMKRYLARLRLTRYRF